MSLFYRICKPETGEGLWYDNKGEFTGLIHDTYDFCKASALPMPFDEELVGWLSATDTLEILYEWFSQEEIVRLQKFGYYVHAYQAVDTKFYAPYQHMVISQKTSRIVQRIVLNEGPFSLVYC